MIFIYNVNARTCVCAEFTDLECDNEIYCNFQETIPKSAISQGSHAMCRSIKWYECHDDQQCISLYQDDETLSSFYDIDWPYHCDSGTFSTSFIDVIELELATTNIETNKIISPKDEAHDNDSDDDNKHQTDSEESLIYLPIIAPIIVILGIVACAMYCKYKENIMYSRDDMSTETSTSPSSTPTGTETTYTNDHEHETDYQTTPPHQDHPDGHNPLDHERRVKFNVKPKIKSTISKQSAESAESAVSAVSARSAASAASTKLSYANFSIQSDSEE